MTAWAANLEALAACHPELAHRLERSTGAEQGLWKAARSGDPTVRLGGKALCSAFDPRSEAARALPDWAEVDFAVVSGLGAGYLAEAAASRYRDLPLVIAESSLGWFAEVLRHRDLSALWRSPWVVPLIGAPEVGAFLGGHSCRTVEILRWRPLTDLLPGWDEELSEQVAQAQARSRANLATFARFHNLWRRNLHRNEQTATARPLSALAGAAQGCSAVIAAAGPSLAESLGWLRTHRDSFLLLAVDTAWPALAAHGLEPDVLLVLDGQYWNARHVDAPVPPRTLVVTDWTGPSRAFRLAPDRTYVATTNLPFLRPREESLWGTLGALPTGGSVATAAWSLALHLGCRAVAFAGFDLGFPHGQTHVPGSQFEEATHRASGRLIPAETRGWSLRGPDLVARPSLAGGTILSDRRMDLFRSWISAAVARSPGVQAYNLSRRGSVVEGLVPATPSMAAGWPPAVPLGTPGTVLAPRSEGKAPPWDALAALLEGPGGPRFERAWAAATAYWGSAWDQWAGRALATWKRFPSVRSENALREAVSAALQWKTFWNSHR